MKFWAGAEVPPWVPSTVMGNVYAGRTRLLDSTGGFEPIPLDILCAAIEGDPSLEDHEAFDDLKALFIAESIALAKRAVAEAATSNAFAELAIERPFQFIATPGHDEPKIVLLELG